MITIPGKFDVSVNSNTAEITISGQLDSLSLEDAKAFYGQVQAAIDIAKHYEAILTRISRLQKPKNFTRKIPKEDLQQIFIRYRVNKESPKIIGPEYGVTDQGIISAVNRWIKNNRELAEDLLSSQEPS